MDKLHLESQFPFDLRNTIDAHAKVLPTPAYKRYILRVASKNRNFVSKALGFELPDVPKTSNGLGVDANNFVDGACYALWLGPDEWLIFDIADNELEKKCSGLKVSHSLVDVSDRNIGVSIFGKGARWLLSSGCPQDLSDEVFGIGACSRTLFGKAEVVIWRRDADTYHLECWRSFAEYVYDYLEDAIKDCPEMA